MYRTRRLRGLLLLLAIDMMHRQTIIYCNDIISYWMYVCITYAREETNTTKNKIEFAEYTLKIPWPLTSYEVYILHHVMLASCSERDVTCRPNFTDVTNVT